jgi:hypothetical protein
LQEIKLGKNTTPIFHVKKESEHQRDTGECSRPKQAWPTWLNSLAAWGLLVRPSSAISPPAFAYAFIYIEKGWPTRNRLFTKQSAVRAMIIDSGIPLFSPLVIVRVRRSNKIAGNTLCR